MGNSRIGYGTPPIVTEGLVLLLDAANPKSYVSGSTTVNDLSGYRNNGTLMNGVGFNTSNSGVFTFDGTNDYISLPVGFSNFTSGFTYSCIANYTSTNIWARLLDMGNGANNNNILFARNSTSNTLTIEIYNGSTTRGYCSVNNGILNNQTTFYSVTLDGVNCKIYRNGILLQTFNYPYLPINVVRNNNYIGRSNWGADGYFPGIISQCLMYNRALSQDEITQNYNSLKSRFGL